MTEMSAREIQEASEELASLIYGDRERPKPTGVITAKGAPNEHRDRQFRGQALWALLRGAAKRHRRNQRLTATCVHLDQWGSPE